MAESHVSVVFSPEAGRSYFACRLEYVVRLPALDLTPADYAYRYRIAQVGLLRWLMNPGDERYTFDLRLVALPDPEVPARGTMDVVLVGRIDDAPPEEVARYAEVCSDRLAVDFDEYAFRLLAGDEIAAVLEPFEIGYLATIRRRAGRERLDTLATAPSRRRTAGFGRTQDRIQDTDAPSDARTLHVYPYRPALASLDRLFDLLLRQNHPTSISMRLRPTQLSEQEKTFLAGEIDKCERYARAGVGPTAHVDVLRPTLADQARSYQHYLQMMLQGLNDDAALLTVEVAAPDELPDPIVDAVGALITEPSGGLDPRADAGPFSHLAGGYEAVTVTSLEAIAGFSASDVTLPGHPAVPPQAGRILYLFDAVEGSAAFRLPPATERATPGVATRGWRTNAAPARLPDAGVRLGRTSHHGVERDVRLGERDRLHHLYAVGRTGTGKTTLLKTMILDDIRSGAGVCVIDPHGDLYGELLGHIPLDRIDDVVLFDPRDSERPVGFNVLEYRTADERSRLVGEIQAIATRMLEDEFGVRAAHEMIGPIFMEQVQRGILLATSNPDDPGTLPEFYTIFTDSTYWKRWVPLRTPDPSLQRWIDQEMRNMDFTRVTASDGLATGAYFRSKFADFATNPTMRNILGQKRSTIDLEDVMGNGKILLVNLGVGYDGAGGLSARQNRLLGMLLLARLYTTAKERTTINRRPFHVYVDEFQALATRTFADMLAELRKFGVSLVLANQFVGQIDDPTIMEAVLGNVGTLTSFRLGLQDAALLEREMYPMTRYDLVNLPNWRAYVRTQVGGVSTQPFDIETIVEDTSPDPGVAELVVEASRAKYGRPRAEVEAEIMRGLMNPQEADDVASSP